MTNKPEHEAALKAAREFHGHLDWCGLWPDRCIACCTLAALILRERAAAVEQARQDWWSCFHCGFETSDRAEGYAHFGDTEEAEALCIKWARLNADGRVSAHQSVLQELNGERQKNGKLRIENEGLQYRIDSVSQEIALRFPGCCTIQEVWCLYDSMEGRALAAEHAITQARLEIERQAKIEALQGIKPSGKRS
jgi:hypothetical protein